MIHRAASVVLIISLLVMLSTAAGAVVLFVDPSATGADNGLSWADAFTNIQSAVDTASGFGGGEVWVKAGTYDQFQPDSYSDSFEARNPDAVDVIGEEMDLSYTAGGLPKLVHITIVYLTGNVTGTTSGVSLGGTTNQDSFATRLSAFGSRSDLLIIANHPSINKSGVDYSISQEDLLAAANQGVLHALELNMSEDIAKWDYVLSQLDDQAGSCSKMIWGTRSNDQHYLTAVNAVSNYVQMGTIPTSAQDPVYADRRLAFKDMFRRGSFVTLGPRIRCNAPTYSLISDDGSASRLQISLQLKNMPEALSAEIRFYGCDWMAGNPPGTLLCTVPLALNSANTVSYHLTRSGKSDGVPLTQQEKARIKYVRPMLVVFTKADTVLSYLQPVRIRANGDWWSGTGYLLAGQQAVTSGSPYPGGGSDSGETVYFDSHSHTLNSDGNASASAMRNRYWSAWGEIDPTKPRFNIVTDHNRRTPFVSPVRCIAALKEGVRLYGGFNGTETSRSQRDPYANLTVIDGQDAGRCLFVDGSDWSDPTNLLIDGFTIKRGKVLNGDGAGLCTSDASPTVNNCVFSSNNAGYGAGMLNAGDATVSNCTFTNNAASVAGGGMLNSPANSPLITGCDFNGNASRKGGAIYNPSCRSVISCCTFKSNVCTSWGTTDGGGALYYREATGSLTGCTISNNSAMGSTGSGAGIYLSGSSPLIANNTIADNTSGNAAGILCQGASKPRVVNNCIAYNSSGVFGGTGTAPTILNNCVYGNAQYNYLGLSAGPGDRSQDPVFIDRSKGNYRLRGDSPCVDAGSNADAPLHDRDGRSVPFDGDSDGMSVADIGAYEFRRIFVSQMSAEPFNGNSWLTAYRTIQHGIDSAVLGDEIWVAKGTYPERVVLKSGVGLFGGFSGAETSREQRNWARSPVIIDGGSNGSTVMVPNGCGSETRLDGFTVRNGNALQGGGLAIYGSTPVITNNTILDNNALYGGGIYCYSSPSATIAGNMITGNTASNGAGLFCSASSGLKLTNNTICGNSASMDGGGILASSSPSSIYNNVVAFNSSGIRSYSTQTLRNNCVFGNAAFNYLGVAPGMDDLSADPLFEDRYFGNYRLTVSSPCINAGTPSAPGLPGLDIEAEGRVFGLSIDIGADEFWLSTVTVSDAKRARDGLSVEVGGALVTAVFGNSFYLESDDRANGIRVDREQHGATSGARVHVHGTVMTDTNGEKYIVASEVISIGSGELQPVALPLRSLGGGNWYYDPIGGVGQVGIAGGAGLNNMCLLVRTVGRVTSIGTGYFYIDDGSGMRDGTTAGGVQNTGVRVQSTAGGFAVGDYLAVTGISSAFADGESIHRLLRATHVVRIDR